MPRGPAGPLWSLTRRSGIVRCVEDLFRDHGLTRRFTKTELGRLLGTLERVEFLTGEALCVQDEPSPGLFLVSHGQTRVLQHLEGHGENVPLTELQAPTVIGEIELVTGRTAVSTVRAVTPVVAHLLDVETYRTMVAVRDSLVMKMLANIAHVVTTRLVESNRRYLSTVDQTHFDSLASALHSWEVT